MSKRGDERGLVEVLESILRLFLGLEIVGCGSRARGFDASQRGPSQRGMSMYVYDYSRDNRIVLTSRDSPTCSRIPGVVFGDGRD